MKLAILDTESNGLFDFSQPADAPGQPRLATLAIILAELNENVLTTTKELNFMVKPEGWEMRPEATAVNGLTTEHLLANGQPVRDVLLTYTNLIELGYVLGAFNAQFDLKMMRGELRRAGMPDRFESTPNFCVMRALTDVCRIPRAKGAGFKFPKLSEACKHFGIAEPAAHSAMGDATSAFLLVGELVRLGLMPKPEVHFAKPGHPALPKP